MENDFKAYVHGEKCKKILSTEELCGDVNKKKLLSELEEFSKPGFSTRALAGILNKEGSQDEEQQDILESLVRNEIEKRLANDN